MSKLIIERDGDVTLFKLNRPEVHNNVDADLAVELAEGIMAFRDATRPRCSSSPAPVTRPSAPAPT
jgi:enoyl-CoA hydratase/carnithine racemase